MDPSQVYWVRPSRTLLMLLEDKCRYFCCRFLIYISLEQRVTILTIEDILLRLKDSQRLIVRSQEEQCRPLLWLLRSKDGSNYFQGSASTIWRYKIMSFISSFPSLVANDVLMYIPGCTVCGNWVYGVRHYEIIPESSSTRWRCCRRGNEQEK